ncbi:hypothetical protein [Fimbriimonas ginsengisoli]|uniref:Lipocalin-like domain-containing protein n=1 Tax=Fimbriimonas ginsengisoli Gsoil 348 TaxID=661478 RepID=A0A068NUW5_FIMGI|nr:hypothetical protein [Fimbriimonas ginsengisoli]AIE87142.1 hypothetical protein OP10G_3774 [Fimbriimonas ginsengisoli Gsoil 348]
MRVRFFAITIASLALAAVASATGQARIAVGKYKWVPAEDTISFYKRHKLPMPSAVLWMNASGVFRHVLTDDQGTDTTLGTYTVKADEITFKIETGDGVGLPRKMKLELDSISATGTSFLRDKKVQLTPTAPSAPAADSMPDWVVGTWTLHRNGAEDSTTRFSFTSNGTFRYKGLGGTSAGTFTVSDTGIDLFYSEIDGEPVDQGVKMHKTLPLLEEKAAFMVDTYRYEKSSAGK